MQIWPTAGFLKQGKYQEDFWGFVLRGSAWGLGLELKRAIVVGLHGAWVFEAWCCWVSRPLGSDLEKMGFSPQSKIQKARNLEPKPFLYNFRTQVFP